MTDSPLPTPIKWESYSCYGVVFFATEEEAETYGAAVASRGDSFNGGFYDGMRCGRDSSRDRRDADGTVVMFAVTTS